MRLDLPSMRNCSATDYLQIQAFPLLYNYTVQSTVLDSNNSVHTSNYL